MIETVQADTQPEEPSNVNDPRHYNALIRRGGSAARQRARRGRPRPPARRAAGGGVPAHAGVGDALAVDQVPAGGEVLAAGDQEALQHHADDAALAGRDLRADLARPPAAWRTWSLPLLPWLASIIRRRVQPGRVQRVQRVCDVGGVVVRAGPAAAQDHVAVLVAGRGHDRGAPVGVTPKKTWLLRPTWHASIATCTPPSVRVLEADRHRQARGELAVHLALGGPRADRAPGHRVGDVLRADRVEELAAHRQAQVEDVQQQPPGRAQAAVHVVRRRPGPGR